MLTQKWSRSRKYQKKETTFHLPKDLVVSLKMRAVQENRAYSAVAEEAIQEYLSKKNGFDTQ
jgi:predicted transcriptional regulator